MEFEGRVGFVESSRGAKEVIRLGTTNEIMVSQANPTYYDLSVNGNLYTGSNPLGTPVTTQAGLSATTPALTLYNPVGSGVNLVLIATGIGITSAPAANTVLVLAFNTQNAGAPTATTSANITSSIVGTSAQPKGQVYRICTLPAAPVAFRILGGVAGASANGVYQMIFYADGQVIIPPGVSISVQSSTAVAIVASFTWEEKPLEA